MTVLELRNVSGGPKRAPAILHDISFSLAAGEVLAICGANGAGKSSLLRLLYRHQAPLSGSVILDGRDLWLRPAREAARIVAAVLQEQPTDFALTTRDIVALGRLPHRQGMGPGTRDRAITDAAMLRMDLSHLADRRFGTLSRAGRRWTPNCAQASPNCPSCPPDTPPVRSLPGPNPTSSLSAGITA